MRGQSSHHSCVVGRDGCIHSATNKQKPLSHRLTAYDNGSRGNSHYIEDERRVVETLLESLHRKRMRLD